MKNAVLNRLSPGHPWGERLHFFPETGSTNDLLKAMARQGAPEGTAILADRQTGGRGRLGRSFHSPGGRGIYLSVLLRPGCSPSELMHLTCASAVAVCDAVERALGLRPGIKWTNDLVHGRRKLGGILTELGLSPQGVVDWAIVGIGINCCQDIPDFPPEIRDMAGSLFMAAESPVSREAVTAALLEALGAMSRRLLTEKDAILDSYRRDCITLGKDISLVRGEEVRHGTALDIDSAGALIVRFPDGHLEAVNSGEVSVRGLYGYV